MNATPGSGTFAHLFSPLRVGPMTVPNRIAETTNTIMAGRLDGMADDTFTAHHVAKAKGGTGWIGNETWLLNLPMPNESADEFFPGAGAIRIPLYLMPDFVPRLARFVDAVHDAGAVAVFQLTLLNFTMAASAVPVAEAYDWVPHALAEDEIEAIVNTYALAAGRFRDAGADGLEIHCAHEALPQTFLSPATNRREDRWGGDPRRRTTFVTETLARVRAAVGEGVALGVRICGQESREGGYDLLGMREMITYVAEAGNLDFVDVDVGHSNGVPPYVQPSYYDHGEFAEVGRAIRADVSPIPVLFAGRVNDPVFAEGLLAKGFCDLVGMTRAGIADPDFPTKAREGRLAEIRRCIGCNRCIGESVHSYAPHFFKKPVCSVNPVVGNEALWDLAFRKATAPRRVVVAGGGPAGLEAARVAAMRGHEVILLEGRDALGGQVRLAARAPGRDAFEDFVYFQDGQMKLLGVDVRLGAAVDAGGVLALEPDAVVVATGSRPLPAGVPGAGAPHVVQGWDVLEGTAEVGERVAVVSQEDHHETPNVADFLAAAGRSVTLFHRWTQVGAQVDRYTIGTMMRRLEEGGVEICAGLRLASVDGGRLELRSPYTGALHVRDGFDTVVLVYGSAPDDRLYRELQGKVERLHLAGSAWVPRRIAEATAHGMRVGLEV